MSYFNSDITIGGTLHVKGWLDAPNIRTPSRGLFTSEAELKASWPLPLPGWWAVVGESYDSATVWTAVKNGILPEAVWRDTGRTPPQITMENLISVTDCGDDDSTPDLNIADEDGNVLASFADGHIRTRNFDSAAIGGGSHGGTTAGDGGGDGGGGAVEVADNEEADLDIADSTGNVILRVSDGHIQTKNFNSADGGAPASGTGSVNRLSMLLLGNSYTADNIGYMAQILEDVLPGFAMEIVIAFISGATMKRHHEAVTDDTASYTLYHYSPSSGRWLEPVRYQQWSVFSKMQHWDIVGIGGNDWRWWTAADITDSRAEGREQQPWTGLLYDRFNADLGYPFLSAMMQTSRYPQWATGVLYGQTPDEMDQMQQAMTRRMLREGGFGLLLPGGAATRNLRASIDCSGIGDRGDLTDEGQHYQRGLGPLCAGYACAEAILRLVAPTRSITGCRWVPTDENTAALHDAIDPGSGVAGITPANIRVAQKCALAAVRFPDERITVYV